MAITVTTGVFSNNNLMSQATVIAASDANTTASVAHGLGAVPDSVILEPLSNKGVISRWFVGSKNTTNVVLTKSTASGSGGATAQLRVTAIIWHSLVK